MTPDAVFIQFADNGNIRKWDKQPFPEGAEYRLAAALPHLGWREDMENAPRDGTPILAWCDHEADPYIEDEASGRLTLYAAHAEGMSHAPTGFHILEWGGAFDDSTWEYPNQASLPDWWFVCGSEFEVAANPTRWQPLLPPEGAGQ